MSKYIENPFLMTLGQLTSLSGLFGMCVEEIVLLLVKGKPKTSKEEKWYLQGLRDKHPDQE